MVTWRLKDLTVQLLARETWCKRWMKKPLSESPFFLTLKNKDKKIFQDYYNILTDDSRPSGAWNRDELPYEGFMDLYEDVKENGIRDISTITINKNIDRTIGDGQHRLAILLHLGQRTITLPTAEEKELWTTKQQQEFYQATMGTPANLKKAK